VSGLSQVFHNATLKGDGTNGVPLGIAIPLALAGTTANVPLVTIAQSGNERVLGIYGNSNFHLLEVAQSGGGVGINSSSSQGTGISGSTNITSAAGVIGQNLEGGEAVVGLTIGSVDGAAGVTGRNDGQGYGVKGFSLANDGIGIYGRAGGSKSNNIAGRFENLNETNPMDALEAKTNGLGFALSVENTSDNAAANGGLFVSTVNGKAGKFEGDVEITGNLSATGAKNFKIDHPLDPENKYLYHASIESSEVLNLYTGNTITDANGDAMVQMPEWFEALNKDVRYQLTVIGTFAQAIIAEKIKGNRFVIKTNAPNVEVSWQVTGVRNDLSMKQHPMQVEVEKSKSERGYYLQPELYNQPADKGIEFARQPEMMKRMQDKKAGKEILKEQRAKLASDK
jgi:trimeric autotransporter adhesin